MPSSPPCARPIRALSHRYYALKARWFGKDKLEFLGPRNAPLPKVAQPLIGWGEAREMVLSAYGDFSPRMAEIAQRFFDERWKGESMHRPDRARRPAPSRIRPVPSAHPYVLLNYQGKPRDVNDAGA